MYVNRQLVVMVMILIESVQVGSLQRFRYFIARRREEEEAGFLRLWKEGTNL